LKNVNLKSCRRAAFLISDSTQQNTTFETLSSPAAGHCRAIILPHHTKSFGDDPPPAVQVSAGRLNSVIAIINEIESNTQKQAEIPYKSGIVLEKSFIEFA